MSYYLDITKSSNTFDNHLWVTFYAARVPAKDPDSKVYYIYGIAYVVFRVHFQIMSCMPRSCRASLELPKYPTCLPRLCFHTELVMKSLGFVQGYFRSQSQLPIKITIKLLCHIQSLFSLRKRFGGFPRSADSHSRPQHQILQLFTKYPSSFKTTIFSLKTLPEISQVLPKTIFQL